MPLANQFMLKAACDELHPKGIVRFLTAKVNSIIAACSIELIYKDTIYGWYVGSVRAFSDYLPNEMLIWHILEWGQNIIAVFMIYDFGIAGKPEEEYGVRDFKAKFGGELVYCCLTRQESKEDRYNERFII